MTLLVLLHICLAPTWLGGCVLLLARAGPLLHTPRVRRALGRVTGVVLIRSGIVVATTAC
jgi:threonine/homoserine/homoserine lactone efflux protein